MFKNKAEITLGWFYLALQAKNSCKDSCPTYTVGHECLEYNE